ncbi:MAG: hypothetical protein ABI573_01585 [Chloroflexota bacterium]
MTHHSLRFPEPTPRKRRSLRETFRDPVRAPLIVGLVLLLIGSALPWMRVWLPYNGFFEVSGFERAGDAGLLLELAAVALILTWSQAAWHSRITVIVAGPFILALVCALLLRVANGDANIYLGSLKLQGGNGSILPAFWAANVGAVVALIAGAIHVWRARARLSFNIGLTRQAVAGAVGGVGGAVAGFLMGTTIAQLLTVGSIAAVASSVVVVLGFLLAIIGGWFGAVGAFRLTAPQGNRL